MNPSLLAAFLAEVAIVSYRQYNQSQVPIQSGYPNLPIPANYTAPVVFYGALALVPESGQTVASMIGWGFVIATLLRVWDPNVKGAASGSVGGPQKVQAV